ncbi:tail spike [Bacillus phage 031MP002]|nr:tail spike [Bacillus phage 031MP002]
MNTKTYELECDRWGISPDGTNPPETTKGFNDALNYAAAEGYREIYIPKGVYKIDCVSNFGSRPEYGGGIRNPSNLDVDMHPEATFLVLENDAVGYSLFYINLAENITMKGGRIIGDRYKHTYTYHEEKTKTHEWGYGIHIRGSKNINIENVFVSDCTGDNIWIAANGMMNYAGSTYIPARDVTIKKCTLMRGRRNCLATNGCEGLLVDDCTVEEAGGVGGTRPEYGIDLEGFGENGIKYDHPYKLIIRNCRIKNNGLGAISSFTAGKVIIEGNEVDDVISYGYSTDVTITNNQIINEGVVKPYGIDSLGVSSTETGNRASIKGNTIRGFNIGINAKGKGILVSKNTIEDVESVGIQVYQATSALVIGNRIDADCTHIKMLYAKKTTVIGNESEGNTDNFAYQVTYSERTVFSGNTLYDGDGGLSVGNSTLTKFKGNTLFITGENYGVHWDASSDLEVSDNTFHMGSGVAIMGYADLHTNIIKDNVIHDSKATYAIYLKGGSFHAVERNTVKVARNADFGYGIYIEGTTGVRMTGNDVAVTNGRDLTAPITTEKSVGTLVDGNKYNRKQIKTHESDIVGQNFYVA